MKPTGFILSLTLALCFAACQKNSLKLPSPVQYSNPTLTSTPADTALPSPFSTFSFTPSSTPTQTYTNTFDPTPTQTSTPTFGDLTLSNGAVTTLANDTYHFNCVNLAAGSVVTIDGSVTIFAQCFTLSAGATIWGTRAFQSDYGNYMCGHGGFFFCEAGEHASGGGAHGGPGEAMCRAETISATPCVGCAYGGTAFDDPVHPTLTGGLGGPAYLGASDWCSGYSSTGGCLLKTVVLDFATSQLVSASVNGTIDMSGSDGHFCNSIGSGGGGGGGTFQANGGNAWAAGAGGGGIVSLIADTSGFLGTIHANNGWGTANGVVTITAPPTSGY
jgi:hypothetical protein